MSNLKVSVTEFDSALKRLNDKLVAHDIFIEIKAIGGYAMLRGGLRESEESTGFTEDIDSIAERFTDSVALLIEEVGRELDLLPDWLNTDPIDLPEVDGVKDRLTWVEDDSYSNIKLYIADINSLLILKARAVEGGGLIPRKTDKNDLIKILRKIGVDDISSVESNPITKGLTAYPLCYNYLKEKESW